MLVKVIAEKTVHMFMSHHHNAKKMTIRF